MKKFLILIGLLTAMATSLTAWHIQPQRYDSWVGKTIGYVAITNVPASQGNSINPIYVNSFIIDGSGLTTGSYINRLWITGTANITGLFADGTYGYVAITSNPNTKTIPELMVDNTGSSVTVYINEFHNTVTAFTTDKYGKYIDYDNRLWLTGTANITGLYTDDGTFGFVCLTATTDTKTVGKLAVDNTGSSVTVYVNQFHNTTTAYMTDSSGKFIDFTNRLWLTGTAGITGIYEDDGTYGYVMLTATADNTNAGKLMVDTSGSTLANIPMTVTGVQYGWQQEGGGSPIAYNSTYLRGVPVSGSGGSNVQLTATADNVSVIKLLVDNSGSTPTTRIINSYGEAIDKVKPLSITGTVTSVDGNGNTVIAWIKNSVGEDIDKVKPLSVTGMAQVKLVNASATPVTEFTNMYGFVPSGQNGSPFNTRTIDTTEVPNNELVGEFIGGGAGGTKGYVGVTQTADQLGKGYQGYKSKLLVDNSGSTVSVVGSVTVSSITASDTLTVNVSNYATANALTWNGKLVDDTGASFTWDVAGSVNALPVRVVNPLSDGSTQVPSVLETSGGDPLEVDGNNLLRANITRDDGGNAITWVAMDTGNNSFPVNVSFNANAVGVSETTDSLNVGIVGFPSYSVAPILDSTALTGLAVFIPAGVTIIADTSKNYKGVSVVADTVPNYKGVSIMASTTIETIDIAHNEIHEGNYFKSMTITPDIATSTITSLYIGTGTNAKLSHLFYEIESTSAGVCYLYESPTAVDTTNFTTNPVYNRYRDSATASNTVVKYRPNVGTIGGTVIAVRNIAGGTGGGRIGGENRDGNEIILKANSGYLLTFVPDNTARVVLRLNWYDLAP